MLATFVCLLPSWDRYFGEAGVLSLVEPRFRATECAWSCFHWTDGIVPVHVWWLVGVLAAIGFTVGWSTRLCTVVLYLVQSSMMHRNRMVVNGEDLVYRMLLFYACFATLDRDLSLAALRRRPTPVDEVWPSAWPIRLMQINVALIYVFSLPDKLASDAAWRDGTAMYFVMSNSHWARWPWPSLFYHELVSAVTTYGALLVEGCFPILVCFDRTRIAAVVTMMAFHTAIAISLQNVTFFSLSMVAALCVFLPGERARRWFAAPGHLTGARRQVVEPAG